MPIYVVQKKTHQGQWTTMEQTAGPEEYARGWYDALLCLTPGIVLGITSMQFRMALRIE
jgi:hypothetical protein